MKHGGMWLRCFIAFAVACMFGNAFDVDILSGRKDPDSCCDKLDNGSFSTKCQQTLLAASTEAKFAYTPGFPRPFPMLKKCSWSIYARPGKRIRLEFRDFYLIGPGDDNVCDSQSVVITSPLSGRYSGPHCGNAGMPSIVSAGNQLVVDLISNIPMTSENYRGFKMSYIETTREEPSHNLRPENWRSDMVLTADPLVINQLFPRGTPASPKRPALKPTVKSSRFRPVGRPNLSPLSPPHLTNQGGGGGVQRQPYPGQYNGRPPVSMSPPSSYRPPNKKSSPLSLEIIVAICVAGVIAIAILVVIIVKVHQYTSGKKKKLAEKNINEKSKANDKIEEQSPPQYDKVAMTGENNPGYIEDTNSASLAPGYYFYYYNESKKAKKGRERSKTKGGKEREENTRSERKESKHSKSARQKDTVTKRMNKREPAPSSRAKTSSKNKKRKKRPKEESAPTRDTQRSSKSPISSVKEDSTKRSNSDETIPSNSLQMRPPGRDPRTNVDKRKKKTTASTKKSAKAPARSVKKVRKRSEHSEKKLKSSKRKGASKKVVVRKK